jgi:hypothetical protein
VPLNVISDVSTVQVGDRMIVIVGVPIPVGLDPDWMREALRESVARAGSAAAAVAYAILATTYYMQMDGRSDD